MKTVDEVELNGLIEKEALPIQIDKASVKI